MRVRIIQLLALVMVPLGALFWLGSPAGAQSGDYQGAVNGGSSQEITITVGQTLSVPLCGYAAYSNVDLVLNGQTVAGGTTDGTGCISAIFVGYDPGLSVNGSAEITATYSSNNSLVATGVNSTGGTETDTVGITLNPAATGAAAAGSSSSSSSSLAFTGADIAVTVTGGIALLAVGALLVVFTRRRSTRQTIA